MDEYMNMAEFVISKVFNEPDIKKACQPQNTFVEYLADALRTTAENSRRAAFKEASLIVSAQIGLGKTLKDALDIIDIQWQSGA